MKRELPPTPPLPPKAGAQALCRGCDGWQSLEGREVHRAVWARAGAHQKLRLAMLQPCLAKVSLPQLGFLVGRS